MRRFSAVTALSAACVVLATHAQSGMPSQQPFRAAADLVQLDVSVLDAQRHPVGGLTVADFSVFEDGKPQAVTAFTAIQPLSAAAATAAAQALAPPTVVVLVMDDATIAPEDAPAARRIAHDVLNALQPSDLSAVVFPLGESRATSLTTDRAVASEAIDAFQSRRNGAPPNGIPIGSGVGLSGGCLASRCVTDRLRDVAVALRTAPVGRKVVVYISPESHGYQINRMDATNVSEDVQELYRDFQSANVAVYAFDPSGVHTGAGLAADRTAGLVPGIVDANRAAQEGLRFFAESTGGRAVYGTNTPWAEVPDVLEEATAYYLLGFQSANRKADGRYRTLSVKVGRSGVDVHTRGGYYAPKRLP